MTRQNIYADMICGGVLICAYTAIKTKNVDMSYSHLKWLVLVVSKGE